MSKDIEPVDIIIPTMDNFHILAAALTSITQTRLSYPMRIILVNNGHPKSLVGLVPDSRIKILETGGQNIGWASALELGLKHSDSEFVMFANDDIVVPASESGWLRQMMTTFSNPAVAGVGPTSNFVIGAQHMNFQTPHMSINSTYLIGFCVLFRRRALDEVGGVDVQMGNNGDDFDLSIRLRQKGHELVVRRDVFIFHYGSVTGTRVHGSGAVSHGWNSVAQGEQTNMMLIRKHGFRVWYETIYGLTYPPLQKGDDIEGDIIRRHIRGERVLDLGCANNKTVAHSIGIDKIPCGQEIPLLNAVSEADVVADVEQELPVPEKSVDTIVARHILEHCLDLVKTIKIWRSCLKYGGRLILAVPDEQRVKGIPLNSEHVHAFTRESLINLMEELDMKHEETEIGLLSIVGVFSRNGMKEGM